MTAEEKIQEIFKNADELRKLIDFTDEFSMVTVSLYSENSWRVVVSPSLLTFGKMTHLMQRGYHAKTLDEALTKALDGSKEELEFYKQGKTVGFK